MEHISTLAALSGVFLLACMSPGPSFMVISSTAVVANRRLAMFVGLGVAAATLTWASAAALGLSLLFAKAPWLYEAIRLAGAAYIIRLGLMMFMAALQSREGRGENTMPMLSHVRHFGRGYIVAVSNPFAAVFVGSVYSAILPPSTPPLIYAFAAGLLTAVSASWHCGVAAIFGTRGVRTAYRRFERNFNVAAGVGMVLLGARLLIS